MWACQSVTVCVVKWNRNHKSSGVHATQQTDKQPETFIQKIEQKQNMHKRKIKVISTDRRQVVSGVMSLLANQGAEEEGLKEKGCSHNNHWVRAALWLVSCRSPGRGRWGGGRASGAQVGGVCSVRGVGACVARAVGHRSLVSWPRATVIILPVHLTTVPAHHHDNKSPAGGVG